MEIEVEAGQLSNNLTLEQRVRALHDAGYTSTASIHRRIQRKVRVSYDAVYRIVTKINNGNHTEQRRRRQRSDVFLTPEVASEIEEYILENPLNNAEDVKRDLGYNVNIRTVQKALKALGLRYRPIVRAPLITEEQKDNRVDFAETHLTRSWRNVIFTDECTFLAYGAPLAAYQWPGERMALPRPKYPSKVNVWGGISLNGKTQLYLFRENLNAQLYTEILEEELLPSAEELYGSHRWYLLQDNDPKHTSNLARNFIADNGIRTVDDWPSSSPDLNPIENIWALLKLEVNRRGAVSLDELEDDIIDAWENLPQRHINSCINSMAKRLQLVIDKNGEKISY